MVRPRPLKYLPRVLLLLILLAVAGFAALVTWVITGPRSLAVLTPYIESALTPSGGGYRVKVGTPLLTWDGWTHPVGIRVRDVDVLDSKNVVIAHFQEVGVRMYFYELLRGKVDIKTIEILNPAAKLIEDAGGNITSFGLSSGTNASNAPIPAALELLTSEQGDNPVTHLKSFIVRHASLSVQDSNGKVFLTSNDSSLEITRNKKSAEGRFVMPLQFGDKRSLIDIRFGLDGDKRHVLSDIVFSEVPSEVLHALAPSQQWMAGIALPLSGRASMQSNFDADIDSIDFTLDAGAGTVNFPDQFEHVLRPQHIRIEGSLTDKLKTFEVRAGNIDIAGHSLAFHGIAHKVAEEFGVDGYAETSNTPVDEIHSYWPLKLSPKARRWVITHVSKGNVAKANVALHFKPGEIKLKDTPEAAVDSTISVKGVTLNYKPAHPPVTNMDAVIRFTGKTMDAKISHAEYLGSTRINSARVRFPDFYPDDVRLFIDMDLDASAKDVQSFLNLPDLDKSRLLGLTPSISGQVTGNAKLDFIAFSENGKDDVGETGRINYTVDGNLKNVSQSRFLGKYDIDDASMKLGVNNKGANVAGKADVNGIPMNISLTTGFARNSETSYMIKADMPVARLPDFGLPAMNVAKGIMGVNATFSTSDSEDKAEAVLDLTNTSLALPAQQLSKKAGEQGQLKLSTERLPSGNIFIHSFMFTGQGINVAGTAEYDKAANDLTQFSLAPAKWDTLDLDSLSYDKKGNLLQLAAKGRVFDASPYLKGSSADKASLDYQLDLRLDRLILGAGREVSDVTAQADCPANACRFARISAKLKDGTPFNYNIANSKADSSCGNAGELVQALGFIDTIEGGKMTMKGQYHDGVLAGDLEVKDYTLKKAPFLTKIFTIASLTGILNTLTGNGIYFDRLTAPFEFHKGNIVIKDAKAHGSALGMTADGNIDLNSNSLNLNGLLVPSYTLNSLIGNLPLIGNLLMGGSGKGLVALSYGIHGDMKDPSIHVNPLSVLTPGFLRDIFTLFDKPPPDMAAIEAAQKAAAPVTISAPSPASASTVALPPLDELKK